MNRLKSIVKISSFFVLTLLYIRIILLPTDKTINLVPDDAFFYFQVAKNLAYMDKITFDGREPATGFHPGWMFLLFSVYKPISFFQKFEPELFYRIGLGLSLLFVVISAILGFKWINKNFNFSTVILPIFVMVLGLKFIWNVGLETEALIALLALHFVMRSKASPAFIMLLSALITFFRIDMLIFFFVLYLLSLVFQVGKEGEKKSISFRWDFLGSILGFAIASLFYLIVSGYPLSTSMYLKSGLINGSLSINRNLSFFERFDLYMALGSFVLLAAISKVERRRFSLLCLYIFSLFLFLLFHILFNRLCAPWYFKLFRYFLIILFFASISISLKRIPNLLFAAVLLVLPFIFSVKWIYTALTGKYEGGATQVYQFSKKIEKKALDPVFVRDYSGIIAFFSGKRVINGDGLINTREFIQNYLLAGLVEEYIKERKIKSCIFSYTTSDYRQYKEAEAIFESACPFFLTCLPNGFYISTDAIVFEDCSERWQKCLVLVDCSGL